MAMALTLQDVINNDLLNELGARFRTSGSASILLAASGFPSGQKPNFDRAENPESYWFDVCERIIDGTPPGCVEFLLSCAAQRLPANATFRPFAGSRCPEPGESTESGESTVLRPEFAQQWDAFLSFSSADRALVRGIYEKLGRRGIRAWMDERDIEPGVAWIPKLEEALKAVRAVVIFVGTRGLGPWQKIEMEIAIRLQVQGQCNLIPVMLPGVTNLDAVSLMLGNFQTIRMADANDSAAIEKIATAIKRPK